MRLLTRLCVFDSSSASLVCFPPAADLIFTVPSRLFLLMERCLSRSSLSFTCQQGQQVMNEVQLVGCHWASSLPQGSF